MSRINPSDIAYDHIPGKTKPPEAKKPKDRSIKFDIFVKFRDMEDEDPIEFLEVETKDELFDALKTMLSWPFIVNLTEITITLEEIEA